MSSGHGELKQMTDEDYQLTLSTSQLRTARDRSLLAGSWPKCTGVREVAIEGTGCVWCSQPGGLVNIDGKDGMTSVIEHDA